VSFTPDIAKPRAYAKIFRIQLQPFVAGPLETMRELAMHAKFRVSTNLYLISERLLLIQLPKIAQNLDNLMRVD
jgi:hypothetical protein